MTEHEANAAAGGDPEIKRVPSHVPGLDTVLCGGFLSGGVYLIQGSAGAGKTVLASQIIYTHAAQGNRALFVTVLGENHGRMMAHLRPMRFFDQALVPDRVTYVSAYQALDEDEEGLKGLTTLLSGEVQARGAMLLVLDGLSAVEAKASSSFEMKRFTHELQALALATDCTMFLLTTSSGVLPTPEHTLVDGVIELQQQISGLRSERRLLVHKTRGSSYLEGGHAFRITHEGIRVFPRTEAQFINPTVSGRAPRTRVSSGIASLDEVFQGGLPTATMAAVVGPTGTGKTTAGLQFLSASSASEPGLLFGCYESPDRLRLKAETMGIDLAAAEQRGEVEMLWYPVGEHILDELAHRLLEAVQRRGVKRLVIDGISGFQQAAIEQGRMMRFWSALSGQLRALGVTTLHTMELPEFIGTEIRAPLGGVSFLSEVLVLLRHVELQSRLYRLISVFKAREGSFDPTIREFTITDAGIVIGKPFEGVEAVLSGLAREAAAARTAALVRPEGSGAEVSADPLGPSG
jgi:circadian clock protein KaiC